MAVNIQPLADYVVAQSEEVSNKTASGLYLPDNAQEKPKVAKILAVGKDVRGVKVGDKIIYDQCTHGDSGAGDRHGVLDSLFDNPSWVDNTGSL